MQGFEEFCGRERDRLRRMAHATRGEMSVEDLTSEAWLMTLEIEAKSHRVLDLSTSSDRDVLFAWLYTRSVKYADKSIRYAVKLDAGSEGDDPETPGERVSRLLKGPDTDDPLTGLVDAESLDEALIAATQSYTQAAAYTLLLARFDWNLKAVAGDLWMELGTLRTRIRRAADLDAFQKCLFDGVSQIDPAFQPTRARGTRSCLIALRSWISRPWRLRGGNPYAASGD